MNSPTNLTVRQHQLTPPFAISVRVQSHVGGDKCFDVLVSNDRNGVDTSLCDLLLRVREPGRDPSQRFGMSTMWFVSDSKDL